jgi:hypothetical protein
MTMVRREARGQTENGYVKAAVSQHRNCLVGVVALCVISCSHQQLTSKPYSDLIGAKYEVAADDLYAYGIYESGTNKTQIGWVDLIPGAGISGPEVAFRRHVSKGQVIKIISAWRRFLLVDNGVYYVVTAEGADLPRDVPIQLQLLRGNESGDADLNPSVYRKLSNNQ